MLAQTPLHSSKTPLPDRTRVIKKSKHAPATNTTPTNQYIVARQFVASTCRRPKNIRDKHCQSIGDM
jgi:hypothetical protein